MSLGSIHNNIAAVRAESLKNELDASRVEGRSQLFRDLLAASTAVSGVKNEGGRQAAKMAEILHLEMMRSALTLDALPPISNASGGSALNSLLAAYGVERQKSEIPDAISTTAVTEVIDSPSPRVDAAPHQGTHPAISSLISSASRRYGVDEGLIKAVIHAESNFKPTAVSSAGAQGLMQLMPATAAGLGVTDSFNPEQNVMAGTRFLKDMLNRYGGDLDKALAAYNWGPGNVDRGNNRLPKETREYLVKVKKLYAAYSVA
jgi:soluble lytic murein transglycosylase-like protein